MLLHFFHLFFNRSIQLVFKLEGLHVIHVPITVEQISLKRSPWSFLCIPGCFGFLFIVSITVIPVLDIWRTFNIVISYKYTKINNTIVSGWNTIILFLQGKLSKIRYIFKDEEFYFNILCTYLAKWELVLSLCINK